MFDCAMCFAIDGELIHLAATHGYEAKSNRDVYERAYPSPAGTRQCGGSELFSTAQLCKIPDIEADPEYRHVGAASDAN